MASSVDIVPSTGQGLLVVNGGVGASPGYGAIDTQRLIFGTTPGAEGVLTATSFAVKQNTGGAALNVMVDANLGAGAAITNDWVSPTVVQYVVAPHASTITVDVSTGHATLPRNDLVVLEAKDHDYDFSGLRVARVRVITGTPTSGAAKTDAYGVNGTPALPNTAIPLAVVNMPALASTVATAQIDDRRTVVTSSAKPMGLPGATAAGRWVGTTVTGAPSSGGPFQAGDWVNTQDGRFYGCVLGGSPGTWSIIGGNAPHYGTGADGSVSVSTSITLTRDMHYTSLTVTGTGTINSNGWKIHCQGTVTVQSGGKIHNNGSNASNVGGGGGGAAAGGSGGGWGSVGGGGAGATAVATGATVGLQGGGWSQLPKLGGTGQTGGTSGSGPSYAGGTGGAALTTYGSTYFSAAVISLVGAMIITEKLSFIGGGTGGGSGGTNNGYGSGAGGGAGGVVAILAQTINVNAGGIIQSNGGTGGGFTTGDNANGNGGGGGGGAILLFTPNYTNSGTVQATGGSGGANGGNSLGGSGGAGLVAQYTIT